MEPEIALGGVQENLILPYNQSIIHLLHFAPKLLKQKKDMKVIKGISI
jgi:hypothetical protein